MCYNTVHHVGNTCGAIATPSTYCMLYAVTHIYAHTNIKQANKAGITEADKVS